MDGSQQHAGDRGVRVGIAPGQARGVPRTDNGAWLPHSGPAATQALLASHGKARDLSALIGLLMLRDFAVVTNATVLRDFVLYEIEAGADVRTVLMQAGRTHVRPILKTAAATILALILLALSSGIIAVGLAAVVNGGLLSSTLLTLVVIPVIYSLLVELRRSDAGSGGLPTPPRKPAR